MKKIVCFAILILEAAAASSFAQVRQGDINSLIMKSKSQQWEERREAAVSLEQLLDKSNLGSTEQKTVRSSLINLLICEAKTAEQSGGGETTEEYSDYFANLIHTVAGLDDVQALDSLMEGTVLTSGNMATLGIAALGDQAVRRVTSMYPSGTSSQKVALIRVAKQMLNARTVASEANINALHSVLTSGAQDENPFVRLNSVHGLAYFQDGKTIELLTRLSISDPYYVSLDGQSRFPIRDDAAKILAAREKK